MNKNTSWGILNGFKEEVTADVKLYEMMNKAQMIGKKKKEPGSSKNGGL